MKKRVLLCVNSDVGRGNTIGFRFGIVAHELKRRGVQVDIIARANYDDNLTVKTLPYKNYLGRFLNALHSHVTPKVSYRIPEIKLFDAYVLRVLKKSGKVYDSVHFGEYAPRSLAYLKEEGSAVYLDIPIGHQAYVEYLKAQDIHIDMEKEKDYSLQNAAIALADELIVPSTFVKETLSHAGVSFRARVIPFGANVQTDTSVLEKFKEMQTVNYVFAGAVNMRKGIPQLLDAWKRVYQPGMHLTVCGRVYKEVASLTQANDLKGVSFEGFTDVKPHFKKAHVFVLPSLLEGSSKAIYEAMSYGMAVITTPNTGSIVESEKTGWIVPISDTDALAGALSSSFAQKDTLHTMAEVAMRQAQSYTWERYARAVADVYG